MTSLPQTTILDLPVEILQMVFKHFTLSEKITLKRVCHGFNNAIGEIDLYDRLVSNMTRIEVLPRELLVCAMTYGREEVDLNRAGHLSMKAVAREFDNIILPPSTPPYHIAEMCSALYTLPLEEQRKKILVIEMGNIEPYSSNVTQAVVIQTMITRLTNIRGIMISVPELDELFALPGIAGVLAHPFITSAGRQLDFRHKKAWLHLSARISPDELTTPTNVGSCVDIKEQIMPAPYYGVIQPYILASRSCLTDRAFEKVRYSVQPDDRDLLQEADPDTRSEYASLGKYEVYKDDRPRRVSLWLDFDMHCSNCFKMECPPMRGPCFI